METTATPVPAQLIVNVEDMSMVKDLKKAIRMLRGVTKVSMPRRKRLTGYEEAMRDVEEGRVYEAESVDDMFIKILGYVPS
ncbi:MAG: response regulator [Alloprevotella sp.]|nr:response regulator [Alloprevotella sp.]